MLRYSAAAMLLALVSGCARPATDMPAASSQAPDATSPVTNAALVDSEHSVAISVPGMMCEHGCPPMVKETLAKLNGATDVIVDFPTKTAIVTVKDKAEFDANAAVEALAANGYKDSAIKAQ